MNTATKDAESEASNGRETDDAPEIERAPLFVGTTRERAKAIEHPKEWDSDVLSFHPNDRGQSAVIDITEEDPLDDPPEYVVVVKVTNPVAKSWIEASMMRTTIYSFVSVPPSAPPVLTTTDSVLESVLDDKGLKKGVEEEFLRRREEFEKANLAKKSDTNLIGVNTMDVWTVSPSLFYGTSSATDPSPHLECIPAGVLPPKSERIVRFMQCHDGAGGAVAIPISFWNRNVRSHIARSSEKPRK